MAKIFKITSFFNLKIILILANILTLYSIYLRTLVDQTTNKTLKNNL